MKTRYAKRVARDSGLYTRVRDIRKKTICNFERPRHLQKSAEDVNIELAVTMRQGETPVPISNTKVKTLTADGTWWVTAWESRWLPLFYF